MAPHSSTLAWKIPWLEKLGRLQSMGSLSQTWLSDFPFTFHFHALEKEMATHSSVLAWRIPGTGEPGGLPSHRVGHDWSDLAAAADSLRKFAQIFSYDHIYFASFFSPLASFLSSPVLLKPNLTTCLILQTTFILDWSMIPYKTFLSMHNTHHLLTYYAISQCIILLICCLFSLSLSLLEWTIWKY